MKHVDACVMSFLFIKRSLSLSFDGHSAPPALLPLAAGYATTTLPCPALTHCTEPPSTDFYRTVLPMLCVCVCASVCVCVCSRLLRTYDKPASQPANTPSTSTYLYRRERVDPSLFLLTTQRFKFLSFFLLPPSTFHAIYVCIYSQSVSQSVF